MSTYNTYKDFEDAVIAQFKKDMGLNGVIRAYTQGLLRSLVGGLAGLTGATVSIPNFSLSAYREELRKEYEHRFNEVKNDPIKTDSLFTKALNTLKAIH